MTERIPLRIRLGVLLCAAAGALSGCVIVPLPHVTQESPRVTGRIIDSATGRPLSNAVVQLWSRAASDMAYATPREVQLAGARAVSAADGHFQIRPRYNFHFVYYANPSFYFHLPFGRYWVGELTVKKTNYSERYFHARGDPPDTEIGDLKLDPQPAKP